jgi:hypothetical protein
MLTRTLVATTLVLGFAQSVSATPLEPLPACIEATLARYLALEGGCSVGDEIGFSDFSFSVIVSGGGAVPIGASDITVTPTLVGDQAILAFASSGFSVTGSGFVTYLLAYSIDPHPILGGFDDFLIADSPTFPGLASITTDLCLGALFIEGCSEPGTPESLRVFHNGITSQLTDGVTFPPLALIGVRNTIELQANGANADFLGFSNGVTSTVPEPGSWLLIGSGLLGARLFRRRT